MDIVLSMNPLPQRTSKRQKKTIRDAIFMAHPECKPEVLALADMVESTSGMLRYAGQSEHKTFIVGTEVGILHPIRKQNPDKTFYPASKKMVCHDMKRIGLSDVVASLEEMSGKVKVPEEIPCSGPCRCAEDDRSFKINRISKEFVNQYK